MRTWAIALVCLGSVAMGSAQDSIKKRSVAQISGAVTQTEVAQVFARVEKTLFRLTKLDKTLPPMAKANAPANRSQILARMALVVDAVKSEFRFTPKRVNFDGTLISVKSPSRAQVERLIAWGFVSKTGPLVTGTQETMTPAEFGDALGMFIARMADLTHTPSSKWSPYMSGDDN